MDEPKYPEWYSLLKKRHAKVLGALEELGKIVRQEGPLDEKTGHLLQLAAAATLRSEGAVHSHTRRALEAGAGREEIYHSLILLTSTIGFPNVAAALNWSEEVIRERHE